MSDDRSKFCTNFLVIPTRKTVRAIVLKPLSLIHSPLKVDRFELLVNRCNIVRFMINKRTRCKIYITHLMIMVHVKDLER